MKTIINRQNRIFFVLSILLGISFAACKKDKNEGGSGAPVITRVRTVSKTFVDSTLTTTIVTYDATGKASTNTFANTTPQTVAFDSTTTEGKLQNMYAIIGSNLGSVTTVSFNGASVYFNKALGTDSTILVSIPKDAPAGPTQSNVLQVTTLHGLAEFKFSILLPAPTVSDVSTLNFSEGSQVVLTGIGLGSVTAVSLQGTNAQATIVAKEDTKLTLTMPATTANSAKLVFTYPSGQAASKQEFVNLANTYVFFTDDYNNGWSGNFWGKGEVSGEAVKTGTKSLKITYAKGNWSANGVANWSTGMPLTTDYKYLSFYLKGGSIDYTLYLTADKRAGGYGNSDQTAPVVVPANVWTYYKIPLASLDLWHSGSPFNQIGFWIKGPDTQDEVFYLDDLVLVK
jgi:hypothetical protein